ncbi:competence type IV pilus minor pilin ComGG [Bacillus sp. FJAT-45037]|uniref:competence type IV pilus minor pilin ComGG n=1 Tax=Bacillus sp. FJAT-45037 TaxID=2011007 RepID=UPI000C239C48|nr:competence type IV pilus minor pilin ComGG [Bacillus sp. FJAT-45037]
MNNERGFVYPLVLILCTLLVLALSAQMNSYIAEKRFVTEQGYISQLDAYMQIGLMDFLNEVQTMVEPTHFFFPYDHGSVTLNVEQKKNTEWLVSCVVRLNDIDRSRQAHFFYDEQAHVIQEYWEVSRRE